MQRHVCLCACRCSCVLRTTGRNSRWALGCCSWPRLSCCCSTAARSAAAGRSLGSTCKSERTCWCCSCRCWPTDTSHHMTRCSPAGCSHGNWARMTLVHILICFTSCEYSYPVYLSLHTSTHTLVNSISRLNRRPTYRPVTATVVLPDRHPHCHFLTRLPVFFACLRETDSIRLNKDNWRRELFQVDRMNKKMPKRRKKRWCTSCCWEISLEGWDEAMKRGKSREQKCGRRQTNNLQWWKV